MWLLRRIWRRLFWRAQRQFETPLEANQADQIELLQYQLEASRREVALLKGENAMLADLLADLRGEVQANMAVNAARVAEATRAP